ncbi:squalene--hopene cyclase [Silvibacterium sp.]|uniref:squalene--hopene cyclase n=1 Tax=Silvibacterium sp. TaxID=1964179 RepID=UPI0039E3839F
MSTADAAEDDPMRESEYSIVRSQSAEIQGNGMAAQAQSSLRAAAAEARATAERAASRLFSLQHTDGYWVGDLTADSTLQSDYILMQMWLYPAEADGSWNPPTLPQVRKAAQSLLNTQRADGGWNIYEPGESEINATVRAYAMLKMTGFDPEDERMRRARALILRMGGIQECNSYTRINLSLFELFPRKYCPTIPPEIMIVPGNVLYEMSSWTRTIIVPLSIVQALAAPRRTPGHRRIEELFHPSRRLALHRKDRIANVFVHADKIFKRWERQNVRKIRDRAIREAETWMMSRLHHSEGLGAIYPSMMYSIMAMEVMGYESDHPDLEQAIRHFNGLMLEGEETLIFQPAKSPVWDTAIAAFALGELGLADRDERTAASMTRAADWLLSKEIRRKGDWSAKRPDLTPSGWVFEFENEFYPDIDDTAMVLLTLLHAKASDPEKQARAEKRAVNWLLGMQSSDGGWAAFDVDNNWQVLNQVPFADHNAMLDPTCPDITGRVLDSLARRGFTYAHPAIERGIRYLLTQQETNGSWYGRWGVNYVYGTFLALRGLVATRAPGAADAIARGAHWLREVQNPDGGWGESCLGYETNRFERAVSTPSQTAWAVLGLIAAGALRSNAVADGIRWLNEKQRPDGTWDEAITTGTGFPQVFYIQYDLYRNYFPVLALATYASALEDTSKYSPSWNHLPSLV